MDAAYLDTIEDAILDFEDIALTNMLIYLCQTYRHISEQDLEANNIGMMCSYSV